MKELQISVDASGYATLSQSVQVSEHCASHARLGFEQICAYPESMRRDIQNLTAQTILSLH
ncbi:hypothetical protein [Caballeronia novacaledonica]|jgi:hypothetical protein|uniref:Uncharacterized protein n=1 Tax=Caballeronia novacaledonica TaxID=1544861 RepID=A0AA37I7M8_9BURK|nr:hypothetical protein [Caballeronia novacaledonica]GJH23992.1 hypothetical protein CBA19CS42_05770 [Caballeronia novacaledonica]